MKMQMFMQAMSVSGRNLSTTGPMSLKKSVIKEEPHVLEEGSFDEVDAENGTGDSGIVGAGEKPASVIMVLLQSYKAALANDDKTTVAKIEAFLLSIEDEKKSLENKVNSLSQELSLERDKILQISEGDDDFRKRTERERLSLLTNVYFEKLHPILDNFEKAKAKIKVETKGEMKINNIYQTIYKQFIDIMGSLGVGDVTVGNPFDPLEASLGESSGHLEVVNLPSTVEIKNENDSADRRLMIQEPYADSTNGTTAGRFFRTSTSSTDSIANCASPCDSNAVTPCSPKISECQDETLAKTSNFQGTQMIESGTLHLTSLPDANAPNNDKTCLPLPAFPMQVKVENLEDASTVPSGNHLCSLSSADMLAVQVKRETLGESFADELDHIPLQERFKMLISSRASVLSLTPKVDSVNIKRSGATVQQKRKKMVMDSEKVDVTGASESNPIDSVKASQFTRRRKKKKTAMDLTKMEHAPDASDSDPIDPVKASRFTLRKKRKKTVTDSVETALEEDAPGLLQVLVDNGVHIDEIKLYGDTEDVDENDMLADEDGFSELESVISKLFLQSSALLKFASVCHKKKGSRDKYCLACLVSLVEQTRYLQFRKWPVEWGWCRDLQSFIFVFERHNRIVVERPEYGYATYFFELVFSLPISWQIKRLVTAMKLTGCSRAALIENKALLVGEDLTEGEAQVLEEYGWVPNSGLGTMLHYCDRVVHDRKSEINKSESEWRSRIGRLLMEGYDGGSIVLPNPPKRVIEYEGDQNQLIKMEI